MDIKISARHMEITDALRQYTSEKTAKLQRYFNRIVSIEVIIDLDGGMPSVEIVVRGSRNSTFVGSHRGDDMYGCIDKAVHKVEEQIRRHKDKVRDHKGPTHEELSEAAEQSADEDQEQGQ